MGRIRTTKPEWFTRADVIECSTSARELYRGMECFADDAGNIEGAHTTIKCLILPIDPQSIEPLIDELININMVQPYESDGVKYYHLRTFLDDQKIDRPGKPRCPAFDNSLMIRRKVVEPSSPEGKGGEGKVKKIKTIDRSKKIPIDRHRERFEELWKDYPEKKGKEKAFLKYKSQVTKDSDREDIIIALVNYKADMAKIRETHPDRAWQHGSTWFNHNWRDFIKPPQTEEPQLPPGVTNWDAIAAAAQKDKEAKNG